MNRPFVFITVGYIIGIIWGLYLNISIAPIFFILGGLFIFFVKMKKINIEKIKEYRFLTLIFIICAIISNIQIGYLENKFDNLYKGMQDVEIIGTVISDKKETEYKANYTIQAQSINGNKKYNRTNLIIYVSKKTNLEYGDMIKIKGTYEKAQSATNYRLFDYREYLKSKDVYGIVNADEEAIVIKKNNLNPILILVNSIKTKIKQNLKEILGEEAEITIGILLRRYI